MKAGIRMTEISVRWRRNFQLRITGYQELVCLKLVCYF